MTNLEIFLLIFSLITGPGVLVIPAKYKKIIDILIFAIERYSKSNLQDNSNVKKFIRNDATFEGVERDLQNELRKRGL